MFAPVPSGIMPPTASGFPQFQPFPVPGGTYAHPAFGQTPPAPLPTMIQPTGASWLSDVPVTANAVVIANEYAKYLEGGDVLFSLRPPETSTMLGAQAMARSRRLLAFNLFTLNHWLRQYSQMADDWVQKNLSGALLNCSEQEFDLAMHDPASPLANRSATDRALLAYHTAHGIRSRLAYLGPVRNQPNLLTTTNIERGSLSAEHGETQVAWVARGPAHVQNVWGADAIAGKTLWLQLKRVNGDGGRTFFQVVPYVSRLSWADGVPDEARFYTGVSSVPLGERCVNFAVGLMVMRGRRTVRDAMFLQTATGVAGATSAALEVSHKAYADLERVQVAVMPRRHGRYVTFA